MHDYHLHTVLCKHATGTTADYVEAARERGLEEICFTDHAPAPDGYDPDNRMVLDEFPNYQRWVSESAATTASRVLWGVEADYYPSGLRFLAEWLPRQGFDLVLGSVHYLRDWGFDDPRNLHIWKSVDVVGVWQEYFRLVGEMAATRLFDVVAHLDLPKKFGHRPKDKQVIEMAKPILDRVAESGMALEISTAGLRKPVGEIYPTPFLLELAREREIPICFGSDAHEPEHVGFAFDQAVRLARECGYTAMAQYRQRAYTLVRIA
mgnify:CR=1 FL=1